jgi:uncharacterized protein (TIGR03118 family)
MKPSPLSCISRIPVFTVISLLIISSGCNRNPMHDSPTGPSPAAMGETNVNGVKQGISPAKEDGAESSQVNLVSDVTTIPAKRTDMNLLNAWGIAATPTGILWIAANHSSLSVVYDRDGNSLRAPVNVPTTGSPTGGAPSGVVFNSTNSFPVPGNGMPAKFIFAGEDGIISAWNSGSNAVVASDRSGEDAVYKGIALGWSGGHVRLYATNFKGGTVEIFDEKFNLLSDKKFRDPGIPSDFGPFNIRNINGKLYVTFAKHKPPDNADDLAGAGSGYVDVFSPEGKLLKRFASKGALNSPWGLAEVEGGRGSRGEMILVANFGDGRINVFDSDGRFRGQLQDGKRKPVTIQGLWAITFLDDSQGRDKGPRKLYFTAGPNEESDGIFGYLNMED